MIFFNFNKKLPIPLTNPSLFISTLSFVIDDGKNNFPFINFFSSIDETYNVVSFSNLPFRTIN